MCHRLLAVPNGCLRGIEVLDDIHSRCKDARLNDLQFDEGRECRALRLVHLSQRHSEFSPYAIEFRSSEVVVLEDQHQRRRLDQRLILPM